MTNRKKAERINKGPIEFEVSDLPKLGWIQIEEMGQENLYFVRQDGTKCFVKLG